MRRTRGARGDGAGASPFRVGGLILGVGGPGAQGPGGGLTQTGRHLRHTAMISVARTVSTEA